MSVIIFGGCYYLYYVSNSNGVPPTDPSMEIKKLEEEFEETLPEIVEETKDGFISNESIDRNSEDVLKKISDLSEQIHLNTSYVSKIAENQLMIKRAITSLKATQTEEFQCLTDQVSQTKRGVQALFDIIATFLNR